jgi:hypothetical protein
MILYNSFNEFYLAIQLALLFLLAFLGIQDLKERKIFVFPLFIFDIILNIIFLAIGYYASISSLLLAIWNFFGVGKN